MIEYLQNLFSHNPILGIVAFLILMALLFVIRKAIKSIHKLF